MNRVRSPQLLSKCSIMSSIITNQISSSEMSASAQIVLQQPDNTSTSVVNQEKCSWTKYSENKLVTIERKILQIVRTAYKGWHVPVKHTTGTTEKIWTISMNTESPNTPLVLLHGFAAGVGFWCLNLDSFAASRPVYAIDLLGFGRSSRPAFSNDGLQAESEMVKSIEEWRKAMHLDSFVLLGHSMGAYLATSYAISYPDRVKHLILADPWGFSEKPVNFRPASLRFRILSYLLYPLTSLNPLATVRAAGPFGPWIVRKLRSDIAQKYAGKLDDHDIILQYVYQCNAQNPTGETAFSNMMHGFGWAKSPMINRTHQLDDAVPVTVLYGEHTWMDKSIGDMLKNEREKSKYFNVEIIPEAGHHVHADNPESFNSLVIDACTFVEAPGVINSDNDSVDHDDDDNEFSDALDQQHIDFDDNNN